EVMAQQTHARSEAIETRTRNLQHRVGEINPDERRLGQRVEYHLRHEPGTDSEIEDIAITDPCFMEQSQQDLLLLGPRRKPVRSGPPLPRRLSLLPHSPTTVPRRGPCPSSIDERSPKRPRAWGSTPARAPRRAAARAQTRGAGPLREHAGRLPPWPRTASTPVRTGGCAPPATRSRAPACGYERPRRGSGGRRTPSPSHCL